MPCASIEIEIFFSFFFFRQNCNSRDGNSFVSSDDVRVKLLVKRRLEYLEETAV